MLWAQCFASMVSAISITPEQSYYLTHNLTQLSGEDFLNPFLNTLLLVSSIARD